MKNVEYLQTLTGSEKESFAAQLDDAARAYQAAAPGNISLTQARKTILLDEYTGPVKPQQLTNEEKVVQQNNAGLSGAFNIRSFRSSILNDGVLPKHSFFVSFAPFRASKGSKPLTDLNKYINDPNMSLRCEAVTAPSPTLYSDEIRRYGFGPGEHSAWGVQFDQSLSLTFLISQDGAHVQFFNDWMNNIVHYSDTFGGALLNYGKGSSQPYDVGYKDDYSNPQMNITVYDYEQNKVLTYEAYEVFPLSISPQDFSWSDDNSHLKLIIRFACTDFKVTSNYMIRNRALEQQKIDSMLAGQDVPALNIPINVQDQLNNLSLAVPDLSTTVGTPTVTAAGTPQTNITVQDKSPQNQQTPTAVIRNAVQPPSVFDLSKSN